MRRNRDEPVGDIAVAARRVKLSGRIEQLARGRRQMNALAAGDAIASIEHRRRRAQIRIDREEAFFCVPDRPDADGNLQPGGIAGALDRHQPLAARIVPEMQHSESAGGGEYDPGIAVILRRRDDVGHGNDMLVLLEIVEYMHPALIERSGAADRPGAQRERQSDKQKRD